MTKKESELLKSIKPKVIDESKYIPKEIAEKYLNKKGARKNNDKKKS